MLAELGAEQARAAVAIEGLADRGGLGGPGRGVARSAGRALGVPVDHAGRARQRGAEGRAELIEAPSAGSRAAGRPWAALAGP